MTLWRVRRLIVFIVFASWCPAARVIVKKTWRHVDISGCPVLTRTVLFCSWMKFCHRPRGSTSKETEKDCASSCQTNIAFHLVSCKRAPSQLKSTRVKLYTHHWFSFSRGSVSALIIIKCTMVLSSIFCICPTTTPLKRTSLSINWMASDATNLTGR